MILDGTLPDSIAQATRTLRSGGLVGLPTETVYGLAANASDNTAVAAIFAAKGRPSDHPLIVHVASTSAVAHFASNIPDFARTLMDAYWPGPLTLILPRHAGVADAATGGQASVGLRCPNHPVALALLQACAAPGNTPEQGGPAALGIAAPSANRFGRLSPTTAQHVRTELGEALLVLDGGNCAVGIESTIIDCTRGAPVLLRPGAITAQDIQKTCGQAVRMPHELSGQAPKASGTLQAHYAPAATVRLMNTKALETGLRLLGSDAANMAIYARTPMYSASSRIMIRRMPDDPASVAQQLFAVLRTMDDYGARLIWIEELPPTPEWDAVRDRLERAAASASTPAMPPRSTPVTQHR